MVGYYRINKNKCRERLTVWLEEVVQEQRWKLYDDLHIDEVSKIFTPRNRWYYSGLFLLKSLYGIIDKGAYDCFLLIPLIETERKTILNMLSVNNIKTELHDTTPPSLYVFSIDSFEYCCLKKEIIFLEELSSKLKWNVYFLERYEYGCFVRSVIFQHK